MSQQADTHTHTVTEQDVKMPSSSESGSHGMRISKHTDTHFCIFLADPNYNQARVCVFLGNNVSAVYTHHECHTHPHMLFSTRVCASVHVARPRAAREIVNPLLTSGSRMSFRKQLAVNTTIVHWSCARACVCVYTQRYLSA